MVQNIYKVLGIMSGTSLDGMDMALCRFFKKNDSWQYELIRAETVNYSHVWKNKLMHADQLNLHEFLCLHNEYGSYTGWLARSFLKKTGENADLIASHGHTIFHQPDKQFTFQLGHGAFIAQHSQLPTVCDFRTMDVAQGGQGAPLVPFGDIHLFPAFDACLNLGGFANISLKQNPPLAFDICPVNIAINFIIREMGYEYDENGHFGKQGHIHHELLHSLNALDYYQRPAPKSLGIEWLQDFFIPQAAAFKIERLDYLRTVYEHVAVQLSQVINNYGVDQILVTGGGAKNTFLMDILKTKVNAELVIPQPLIVDFKEALIFAFIGLMKILDQPNTYASVTGGKRDISSGVIYRPT